MLNYIRSDVKFNFKDAGSYSKEFHVALINEIIKAGVEQVNKSGIRVEVNHLLPKDIGYSYENS